MSKKSKVTDISLPEVIDLVAEPIMKQKRVKKIKEVLDAVVEMPVIEAVVEKPKKARKVKSLVPEELELNRNYETPVKEKEVKTTKKSNCWIDHIKQFSIDNGLTYNKSMIHPDLKKNYVKTTKGRVSLN